MLPAFEYLRISSVEEGCQALAEAGNGAVLAGGTDLLVQMRSGHRSPELLIDGKRIEAWRQLTVRDEYVEIGASVPLARLVASRELRAVCPALCTAAQAIGTATLRNRATLVGNLCNASPAADTAPVLLVLDATVCSTDGEGSRRTPMADFFQGVRRTTLGRDEIVTSVTLSPAGGLRTVFHKQQRIRGHDLAVVNLAGSYSPQSRQIRVAIGSCAPIPVLLPPVEVHGADRAEVARRVLELARRALSPISDVRATSSYRWAVLEALVHRAIEDLLGGGRR